MLQKLDIITNERRIGKKRASVVVIGTIIAILKQYRGKSFEDSYHQQFRLNSEHYMTFIITYLDYNLQELYERKHKQLLSFLSEHFSRINMNPKIRVVCVDGPYRDIFYRDNLDLVVCLDTSLSQVRLLADHSYLSGYLGLQIFNILLDTEIPDAFEYGKRQAMASMTKLIANNPLHSLSPSLMTTNQHLKAYYGSFVLKKLHRRQVIMNQVLKYIRPGFENSKKRFHQTDIQCLSALVFNSDAKVANNIGAIIYKYPSDADLSDEAFETKLNDLNYHGVGTHFAITKLGPIIKYFGAKDPSKIRKQFDVFFTFSMAEIGSKYGVTDMMIGADEQFEYPMYINAAINIESMTVHLSLSISSDLIDMDAIKANFPGIIREFDLNDL